jgi:hypothetical protein
MLKAAATEGMLAACATFGIDPEKFAAAVPGGLLSRGMGWLRGQGDAAKSLVHNVRGGFGGKLSPEFKGSLDPSQLGLAQSSHRGMAMQNLKTLAPSMLAVGGLGLLHHQKKKKEQEMLQQQQMGGY